MTNEVRRGEKLAYAVGDMGLCLTLDVVYQFQLFFFTDVIGIGAALAGGVVFFARAAGSLFDVPAGLLADRTRTRFGRFRPWVAGAALPLVVMFSLVYYSPPGGELLKASYAAVTLGVYMLLVSLQNTPYSALGGVMSASEHVRASIASWRVVGALAGGMIVSVCTLPLAKFLGAQGGAERGWLLTSLVYAAFALPLMLVSGMFPHERVEPASKERMPIRAALPAVLRTPGAKAVLLAGMAHSLAGGFSSNGFVYYFKYLAKGSSIGYPTYGFVSQAATACAVLFITARVTRRFAAVRVASIAYAGAGLLSCVYFFLPASSSASLLGVCALRCVVYAPAIALFWTLLARVADTSGGIATALVFGLACFLNKTASAAGSSLFGCGLSLAGFVPATEGHAAEVTSSTVIFMRLAISFIPAVFMLLASFLVHSIEMQGKCQKE